MVAPPDAVRILLPDAVDTYLDSVANNVAVGSRSAATLDTYTQHLRFLVERLGSVVVDDITGADVDGVLVAYARSGDGRRSSESAALVRKSAASQRIFRAALSAFFTDCVHRNWCQLSPMDYVSIHQVRPSAMSRNPAREALTAEQAQALLDVGAGDVSAATTPLKLYRHYLDKAVLATLLLTGLRNSELCALRWDDFVRREGGWVVRVAGKGARVRFVPVTDSLYGVLREYRAVVESNAKKGVLPHLGGGWVFCSPAGVQLSPLWVSRCLGRARRRVGEDSRVAHLGRAVVPHGLRHTAATLWLASGDASLPMVRDMLGHANVATTSLYLASDSAGLSEVASSSGLEVDGG